ncbi:MAG: hypothetical protein ABIS51_22465, partial [Sphingomonas sp.]
SPEATEEQRPMGLVEIDDQTRIQIGNRVFRGCFDHDMGLAGCGEIDVRHDPVGIASFGAPGYSAALCR